MKAKSIKGKTAEEIKHTLKQSMADGFKPTLAFVFLSVNQDRDEICKVFNDENISIYGSTTNGECIDEAYGTGNFRNAQRFAFPYLPILM